MQKAILLAAAVGAGVVVAGDVRAAVSYNAAGSTYTQNFDSLPTAHPTAGAIPQNAPLQPTPYAEGWRDDTTSDANHVGLPGWYLFHQSLVSSEGGFSDFQRFRYGDGSSSAGSFYAFAAASGDGEKALGVTSATPIQGSAQRSYLGLQLVNNTGQTLTSFTVKYDGEQWRDGGSAAIDGFDFQWSFTRNNVNWISTTSYDGIADSFLSPKNGGTATALDGNAAANRIAGITHTINNITWAPGAELWVRWRDREISGNDDGISIDNVEFSTFPEPASLAAVALGAVGLLGRRRTR